MIRIYVAAAVIALAALGYFQYQSIAKENATLKKAVVALAGAIEERDGIIAKERAAVADAKTRAETYLTEKRTIENEAKTMRDCIADESCGVRVKWKVNACPSLSGAGASRPGADGATESDTRDFEAWVVDLEESIRLNIKQIEKLQVDIKIRADPDYCKPQ